MWTYIFHILDIYLGIARSYNNSTFNNILRTVSCKVEAPFAKSYQQRMRVSISPHPHHQHCFLIIAILMDEVLSHLHFSNDLLSIFSRAFWPSVYLLLWEMLTPVVHFSFELLFFYCWVIQILYSEGTFWVVALYRTKIHRTGRALLGDRLAGGEACAGKADRWEGKRRSWCQVCRSWASH